MPSPLVRVAIASYGDVDIRTVHCFMVLAQLGLKWNIVAEKPTLIARESLLDDWMKDNDEPYLLFVDTDMLFSPNDVTKLVKAMEEMPDVGAMCALAVSRDGKNTPLVGWFDSEGKWVKTGDKAGKIRYHLVMKEPVDTDLMSGGMFIVRRKAVEDLDKPYWKMYIDEDGLNGEDFLFGHSMKQKGWRVCVHFGVHVGHIGRKEYFPNVLYNLPEVTEEEFNAIQHRITKSS